MSKTCQNIKILIHKETEPKDRDKKDLPEKKGKKVMKINLKEGLVAPMKITKKIAGKASAVLPVGNRPLDRRLYLEWENTYNYKQSVREYLSNIVIGKKISNSEDFKMNFLGGNSLLVTGLPGSGKTVFLESLIATLTRHPDIRVAVANRKDKDYSGLIEGVSKTVDTIEETTELLKEAVAKDVQTVPMGSERKVRAVYRVLFIDSVTDYLSGLTANKNTRTYKKSKAFLDAFKEALDTASARHLILVMSCNYLSQEHLPKDVFESISDKIIFPLGERGLEVYRLTDSQKEFIKEQELKVGEALVFDPNNRYAEELGTPVKMFIIGDRERKENLGFSSASRGEDWI